MTVNSYTLNFNSHLSGVLSYCIDFYCQWTIVTVFCVLLFSFKWIFPRFGLVSALLFTDLALSSIWVWLFEKNRYVTVDPYTQMALRYFSCDSIAKIMLIAIPFMTLSKDRSAMFFWGKIITAVFMILSCLVAFWEYFHDGCTGLTCGGLVGNPSISMGVLACMLPIVISSWKRQWPVLLTAVIAIVNSKSSIALGLLAVYGALYFSSYSGISNGFGIKRLVGAVLCFIGILGFGYCKLGGELLNDSDRFKIWRFMMQKWNVPWNWLNGTGSGTYHVFSINLQNSPGHEAIAPGFWWNTFHQDVLQVLFELGVIGLILFLATYFSALWKVVKEKEWHVAMSIILFGFYMNLDPALHNPVPVLFGAWLFTYALRKPKECL